MNEDEKPDDKSDEDYEKLEEQVAQRLKQIQDIMEQRLLDLAILEAAKAKRDGKLH